MERFTVTEARLMTLRQLQVELGKCVSYLENQIGMEHIDACEFVSGVINLGIATNEKCT